MDWIGVGVPVPSAQELDPTSEEYNPNYACLSEDPNPPLASEGFSVWLGQLTSQPRRICLKGPSFVMSRTYFQSREDVLLEKKSMHRPQLYLRYLDARFECKCERGNQTSRIPTECGTSQWKHLQGLFYRKRRWKGPILFESDNWKPILFYLGGRKGLSFLKTLCETEENGKCIGTGSAYSDRDPAALSPDPEHEYLVTMTVAENNQRVWRYRTNAEEPKWTNVVSTPPGTSYWNNACSHMSEPALRACGGNAVYPRW